MKRFEAKPVILLSLPSVALLIFAAFWPHFQQWQAKSPSYELVQYEIKHEKSPFPVDAPKIKGETFCLNVRVNFSHRTTFHTLRRLGNRRPMDYYSLRLQPRCLVKGKQIQPLRRVYLSHRDHVILSFYYDVGAVKPSENIVFDTTLRWREDFPNQELPRRIVRLRDFQIPSKTSRRTTHSL